MLMQTYLKIWLINLDQVTTNMVLTVTLADRFNFGTIDHPELYYLLPSVQWIMIIWFGIETRLFWSEHIGNLAAIPWVDLYPLMIPLEVTLVDVIY